MLRIVSSATRVRQVCHVISKTLCARTASSVSEHPLLSTVAKGDVSTVSRVLQDLPVGDVNVRDERGWSALMIAAKHGHVSIVDFLLQNGADHALVNRTGQSAFELAVFWKQRDVAELLREKQRNHITDAEKKLSANLYRQSTLREDKEWLRKIKEKPNAVFIATHMGNPVVVPFEKGKLRLSRFTYDQVKSFADDDQRTVFLGTDDTDQKDQTAYFCIDMSALSEAEMKETFPGMEIVHIFRLLMFQDMDKKLIKQARPLLDWHKYQFCPKCGNHTKMDSAGYKRVCVNDKCTTHRRIHNISYPRVDPTIICTVISHDGRRCLLTHKENHPFGMYTCISGFVEPGETMEEACVREVEEEVGLNVREVRYHSSQAWPMPSCLMAGYMTKVTEKDDIQLDKKELEDGRWFSREEVVEMMTHEHPTKLFVPPVDALAHHLIKTWIMESEFSKTPV